MRRVIIALITALLVITPLTSIAKRYGRRLCKQPGYTCVKVKRGESWRSLFPDQAKRRLMMRVNRTNTRLWAGLVIAVPNNLHRITHMDISPMPYVIQPSPTGRNIIYIDLTKMTFGAYDRSGYLIHWGPVAGGRGYCPDVGKRCNTPRGNFYTIRKGGADCISKKFPIPEGGAKMPYCIFFFNGYAMHGGILPGFHASHGCVRMFYEDAEWINQHFIKLGRGATRVIVR